MQSYEIGLHIDPKNVPSSKILEQAEQYSSDHECGLRSIKGYNATFSNTDLLKRHVV
jgi:hypothetical protein